jgi:hypothetical protein
LRELALADLIRVGKEMADALITVQKYVKYQTGTRATDSEIANTLKSYFIMNEIGNQIKFRRKKTLSKAESEQKGQKGPLWTMNLIGNTLKSNLSKAGLFPPCIEEGIQTTANFVKNTTGQKASLKEIAKSLSSSFILSEIKNQIDWQRKNPEKADQTNLTP